MRKLNYLLLFFVAFFAYACSSTEDDKPKLSEKAVTIEVEMGGDYADYLVTLSVHSMLSGKSTFVAPQLVEPSALEWTQIIEQGNTYSLTYEPSMSSIEVQSASNIHSLGFVFNAVALDATPDDGIQPLIATIRVLADGEVYKEYSYEALDSGEITIPVSESITFE